jgi:histidinol dehydrogenase
MIAQAEHDPRASVVTVGASAAWIGAVSDILASRVGSEPRAAIIEDAFRARGALLVANDRDEALEFAAEFAPEHLLLAVADPDRWLPAVRNAGTVMCGAGASVAFGDYLTGANHVLPTGGLARCYSGLSPLDFVRWTTYQVVDRDAAARLAGATEVLALAERLPGHASAARCWRRER